MDNPRPEGVIPRVHRPRDPLNQRASGKHAECRSWPRRCPRSPGALLADLAQRGITAMTKVAAPTAPQSLKDLVEEVFNNITSWHLASLARPAGATDRSALPIAGDDPAAKAAVTRFLDAIGYDTVGLRLGLRAVPATGPCGTVCGYRGGAGGADADAQAGTVDRRATGRGQVKRCHTDRPPIRAALVQRRHADMATPRLRSPHREPGSASLGGDDAARALGGLDATRNAPDVAAP